MDEKTIPVSKLPVDVKVQIAKGKRWDEKLDYRALFEQMGECVFIIGLDFHFITANPQALELLGYDDAQLMGKPVENIIQLQDAKDRELILDQHLSTSEQVLIKRDGTLLPVELSISVVQDSKSKPVYIQMIARDITERKQTSRILKRHARALAVIGEVSAGLFRSKNIIEKIPEVLESMGYAVGVFNCTIFDLDETQPVIKYKWTDPLDADFDVLPVLTAYTASLVEMPDRVFSVTDVVTHHEKIPQVSFLVIPIQGLLGSWGFLALFDKQEKLSWLPAIFDIVQTTANLIGAALERVHNEEILQLSEARNRVVIEALPDLLLRIDLNGKILDFFANEKHPLRRFRDEVLGRNVLDFLPKELLKDMDIESAKTFNTPARVENIKLPQSDGIFEAQLHPISSQEALIIVRDTTEQARLDQMKSDFINRASHELRTPLTSAILMAGLIQQGGTPDELDEYWRTLNSELNRQKNLINELLIAGRLESGAMKIEVVPMDLMPVLQESIQAVKPIALKKQIALSLISDFSSIQIQGDKSGLQQVFINLVNNAVKFSPEKTSVEIEVAKTETNVSVSITDHGLGIPADSIPHLFERFYRAKNVTVAEIPGSGIGLYIVKTIVEELGGDITVDSRENQGTTFTVRLLLAV
jgi:PAS domain S-box-containing protein